MKLVLPDPDERNGGWATAAIAVFVLVSLGHQLGEVSRTGSHLRARDRFVISVASDSIERAVPVLDLSPSRFDWSVNFRGQSAVSIQLSTEELYRQFPARCVAADVHGILLRVASLEDTLRGKMRAWSDPKQRQSKRLKDLADIARLLESHPRLEAILTPEVRRQLQ